MTMTTYPTVVDLSFNHCASNFSSVIVTHGLQQIISLRNLAIILEALTVIGIINVFSSLLFFFTYYFLILRLNKTSGYSRGLLASDVVVNALPSGGILRGVVHSST